MNPKTFEVVSPTAREGGWWRMVGWLVGPTILADRVVPLFDKSHLALIARCVGVTVNPMYFIPHVSCVFLLDVV